MAQMNLFGSEATALVQNVKKGRTRIFKEQDINDLKWEIYKSEKRIAELQAQDETGWADIDISLKGKKANIPLCEAHISYYKKQIIEKRAKFQPLLVEWRTFIEKLCQERSQPIDIIWFDTSSPYDCCIEVRMKNHRCWNSCVSFRFQDNKLQAFDSHFGGGTSFVAHLHQTHIDIQNKIREVMEKVFAKECTDSGWEDLGDRTTHEHREIKIDEMGWNDNGWLR